MPKKVLIIENDAREWEYMREIFTLRGDEPVWIRNEIEALRVFGEEDFDLVLIEAILPRIDGYKLCQKLKSTAKGKNTPILMMGTVLRNFKLAQQARHKYGADAVLVKPFDPVDLKTKMDKYLAADSTSIAEELDEQDRTVTVKEKHREALLGNLPHKGLLDEYPAYLIIPYFADAGYQGILTLESGKAKKLIHYQDHRVAFVTSNLREETLGQILLASGTINEETYRNSLDLMIREGRKQGEVLLEMGVLSPHDLFGSIKEQTRYKVMDLLSWIEGSYEFNLVDFVFEEDAPLDLDIFGLIKDGIERYMPPRRVKAALRDLFDDMPFRVRNPLVPLAGGELTSSQRRLLEAINGRRNLKDVERLVDLSRTEFYRFVVLLIATGNVALVPASVKDLQPAPLSRDQIRSVLQGPQSEELSRWEQEIGRRYQQIRNLDFWQTLEVSPGVNPAVAEDAYRKHSKFLEGIPDRESLNEVSRLTLKYVEDKLKNAFEKISQGQVAGHGNGRMRMRTNLVKKERSPYLTSEVEFRKGLSYLDDERFDEAVEAFSAAVELSPDTADYHAYLGWALYNSEGGEIEARFRKAKQAVDRALKRNANSPVVHLIAGRLHFAEEDGDEAELELERVLDLDPDNVEALRLLWQIHSERESHLMDATMDDYVTDPDVLRLRTELDALFDGMYQKNHYQILGVTQRSSYEDIKRGFYNRSAEIRDDPKVRKLGVARREKLEAVLGRIMEAYEILCYPESRRAYDYFINLASGKIADIETGAGTQAERCFAKGLEAMERKDYRSGRFSFQRALDAYPLDPRYHAYQGYAIFCGIQDEAEDLESEMNRARESIGRALFLDSSNEEANAFMAEIFRSLGKHHIAEDFYRRTLESNPNNLGALRGMHALHARRRKKKVESRDDISEAILPYTYKIEVVSDRLKRQNYFDMLEVGLYFGDEDLARAYDRAREQYAFEEIFNDLDEASKEKVRFIRSKLEEAHQMLSDEEFLTEYRRKVRMGRRSRAAAIHQSTHKGKGKSAQTGPLGERIKKMFGR